MKSLSRPKGRVRILMTFITVFSVLSFQNCQSEEEITGEERENVLKYAEPAADSILAGHNEMNYAKYSKDFDETMKNALTEPVFRQKQGSILSKIGKYRSRKLIKTVKQSGYVSVIYSGEFEKESGVVIRVVFKNYGDKNLAAGLWFNSPKLRE